MSDKHSRFRSAVLCVGLLVAASVLVTACHEGSRPTAPAPFQESSLEQVSGYDKPDRQAVCHVDDEGTERTVMVPARAVDPHLRHGDTLGECSTVSCPCYTREIVDAVGFENPYSCTDTSTFVQIRKVIDGTWITLQNLSYPAFNHCSLTTAGSMYVTPEEIDACNAIARAKQVELGCI